MKELSSDNADPTGYLQEKSLDFHRMHSLVGLREYRDPWFGTCLQYPLINVKGEITGGERIFPRGVLHKHCPDRFTAKDNKKVTKGTKVSESFALIGITLTELPCYFGPLRVVGGSADAVSVYFATGEPVVCIVGEHNARSVATKLTETWPHLAKNLIVALDHDLPGISACHRAGFRWAVPQRFGEDWSDVRLKAGQDSLKQQLGVVRNPIDAINLNTIPEPAVEMLMEQFCGDYQAALKRLTAAQNEQVAATLAKAIVIRFHQSVPSRCDECDFIRRIQAANPYFLHPETLQQLRRILGGYCRRQQEVIQKESGLNCETIKAMGDHYHQVDTINPKTVPLEKGQITLIKAPYAAGKTKLMSALSRSALQTGERVLTITHLVSLAHELGRRLALDSYLDIPVEFMSTVPRLVTCINSLCAPNVSQYLEHGRPDILMLDEFCQHISVLGTSPNIKDPSILSRYQDLIEKTSTVVICDADLSSYHVRLLKKWYPERDIHFYEMPFPKEQELLCQFASGRSAAKSVTDHQLLPAIAQGKKVAVATDNRTHANLLERMLRKQFPDISLLLVHGKNRSEVQQQAFLKDCDKEAEQYQVIIFTSAIQSGLSIQTAFDQTFGFSHNILLQSDFVQMLRRFRTVKAFTVVGDMTPARKGNEDWLSRVFALEHVKRYSRNTDDVSVGEYDAFCEEEKSRQIKLRSLGGNGLFYLMQQRGFSMDYYQHRPASEQFEQQWKDVEMTVEQEEIIALQQSPVLSWNQFDQLSHKVEPSTQELYSCERFRICEELGILPHKLDETDIQFWRQIGLQRLRRFMQFPLSDGSHYLPQHDKEATPACHRRFESVGVEVYRNLLEPLFPDWDYSQSWGEQEAEKVVDRVEAYQQNAPFMLNQLKLIPDTVIRNTQQGARFQRPKSACNFVNRLLRMAGLTIASKQVRTGHTDSETGKGIRVRRYSIEPESLELMRKYAHSRAVHKLMALT